MRFLSVVAEGPDGRARWVRLSPEAYSTVVAATNFKQRVRKMMEYHYANMLRYAVVETVNRLEYDQGFFVKNGDGAANVKLIAHLYYIQIQQLVAYFGVPEEIRRRPMTTDAYPFEQSGGSYFMLPLDKMDLCLYGRERRHTGCGPQRRFRAKHGPGGLVNDAEFRRSAMRRSICARLPYWWGRSRRSDVAPIRRTSEQRD